LALALRARAQDDAAAALNDLLANRDVGRAQGALLRLDHAVVIPMAEAAFARETADARGKANVLGLLSVLGRGDVAAAALASPSVVTRRAAAAYAPAAPGARDILLAWLDDAAARDRAYAVSVCATASIAEARPRFVRLVHDSEPETFAAALRALSGDLPPDLVASVRKRLADPKEDPVRVAACIDALPPEVDATDLLAGWLRRRDAGVAARAKAAFRLRDAGPLKAVLLDADETDSIVQRACLFSLAKVLDDAALLEILRHPGVARHRYFGIRCDVTTALACNEGAGAADFPLLLDLLVEEDPADEDCRVRAEAWLTLWTLTGKMHGAPDPDIFARPPPRGDREYRLRLGPFRAGVTWDQARALTRLARDLAHMRKVREAYAAE
jgi:hypothetical protein